MAINLNPNVSSFVPNLNSQEVQGNIPQQLEQINTVEKPNRAADDGSGAFLADKLLSQVDPLGQSIQNGNDLIAKLEIAEKGMSQQAEILDTVNEKIKQAAESTSNEDRATILNDVQNLIKQFDDIATSTKYNGTTLLQQSDSDMSKSNQFEVQTEFGSIGMDGIQSNSKGLKLDSLLKETSESFTIEKAKDYQNIVNDAVSILNSGFRGDVESTQNQINSYVVNTTRQQTNIEAASSVIRDIDFAAESQSFDKQNIIAQAGSYAMSQANSTQVNVMRLLQ